MPVNSGEWRFYVRLSPGQRWQEIETDACDPLMSGSNGCKVYHRWMSVLVGELVNSVNALPGEYIEELAAILIDQSQPFVCSRQLDTGPWKIVMSMKIFVLELTTKLGIHGNFAPPMDPLHPTQSMFREKQYHLAWTIDPGGAVSLGDAVRFGNVVWMECDELRICQLFGAFL